MKNQTLIPAVLAVLAVLYSSLSPALAQSRWRGADGEYLPFETEEEILGFLREAEVVKRADIPQGINKPLKVRLRQSGVEANAIFRTVNTKKARHDTGGKVYVGFHDSYQFECAAYEVSRLLGLDHVPPCVLRNLGRRRGTMQIWIEEAMTEIERRKKNRQAPVSIDWVRQRQTMRLFDALIYNFDRNQGNMLIDKDWKLWFIDHTRSFHRSDDIEKLERIIWVERRLWESLRALDREKLEGRLAGMVDQERLEYLLRRREVLVKYIEGKIAQMGEDVVIYDASKPAPSDIEDRPDFSIASSAEDIPEESPPVDNGGG